jgi:hypothetical protein
MQECIRLVLGIVLFLAATVVFFFGVGKDPFTPSILDIATQITVSAVLYGIGWKIIKPIL